MRKPVGLDLDGWHDFACRDWSTDDPDEPPGEPRTFDGGIGSVVVTHEDMTIGGPQAILSPIGRGPGWGASAPVRNAARWTRSGGTCWRVPPGKTMPPPYVLRWMHSPCRQRR